MEILFSSLTFSASYEFSIGIYFIYRNIDTPIKVWMEIEQKHNRMDSVVETLTIHLIF